MEVAYHYKDFGPILRVRKQCIYFEESGFLLSLREKKIPATSRLEGKEKTNWKESKQSRQKWQLQE